MSEVAANPPGEDLGSRVPVSLAAFQEMVLEPVVPPARSRHPIIVDLQPGEFASLSDFCEGQRITLIDEFDRQAHDLAAVRLPAGSRPARERFVDDLISAKGDRFACGTWVYLPWESKAVHLLGPDDYFEVITNRNRDKITALEQQRLRSKTVGVMGLSLGGDAAVAVAQEHLCGRLLLADFDHLDLSNLNRLNAGFDDLGLPKTTIAARRVAKLDPYLRVTLFDEGVTSRNAPAFLDGLDLLIEECDGLGAKFEVRVLARERGLNIVFAGDERGFLSIEPHAHDPDLPVFHGLIDEPQPSRDAFPSSRAFLAELTKWLGGWRQISQRTRASLEQVGDSLCGYPQLASEARFAAAQVGHVARRLLLDEALPAFIGHLDLDELIRPDGAAALNIDEMPEVET